MPAVGVIEIVAGILVALRPRIGGYVIAAWLAGIIINQLLSLTATTSPSATSDYCSMLRPWHASPQPRQHVHRSSDPRG